MSSLKELKKNYVPIEVPLQSEQHMQWFRDAKFGMFIHWGLYSLLGRGEWVMFNERMNVSEYAKLADSFTAEGFDAKAWARTAKNAGMKYMVLTARHHDGFCLYNSKVSSFNSVNSAAKRDFVAEYVDAARAEGLKVGLYYSPMDWRFPGYFFPEMYFENALEMREQCREQLRELMTNYGKIDMLWYDGQWLGHGGIKWKRGWYTDPEYNKDPIYFKVNYFWESEKINAMVRELQPTIMINNRSGWEGDFDIRERFMGEPKTDRPWDSSDCLANSWGWIPDTEMLSLRQCIYKLIQTVARDGTLLLNVGPTGEGIIEPRQVERLKQIGQWLEEYGESIYYTRGGPFHPAEWGGTTFRENKVYVHILEWNDDVITLPAFNQEVVSYKSLTSKNLHVEQSDKYINISVPVEDRHSFDTIVVLCFKDQVTWEGVASKYIDEDGKADGI